MKLSLATPELLAQLQTVSRVASTRSAVQALTRCRDAGAQTAVDDALGKAIGDG